MVRLFTLFVRANIIHYKIGTTRFKLYEDDVTYTGHLNADGKAFGWGRIIDKYGQESIGTFKNNRRHGIRKQSIYWYSTNFTDVPSEW